MIPLYFLFRALINTIFYVRTPNLELWNCALAIFYDLALWWPFWPLWTFFVKPRAPHEFLGPTNHNQVKKLWKYNFFSYLACTEAFMSFMAFNQFFRPCEAFHCWYHSNLVKFGAILTWNNFCHFFTEIDQWGPNLDALHKTKLAPQIVIFLKLAS